VLLDRVRRLSAEGKQVRVHATAALTWSATAWPISRSARSRAVRPRPPRRDHQLHAVVRVDALFHGDAVAELDDGSSVVVSRTHRDAFFARWRGR
jgi:hypothetical protein